MMGVAAGVLVLAGSVVGARSLLTTHRASSAGSIGGDADQRHVGVLYFADESRDGSLRFLADGLTESLIDELARVPQLQVVSRNGVRPFRGLAYDAVKDSVPHLLKVGTVVRGEVEPAGKGAQVTVRLVDAVSGSEIVRKSFDVDTANVLVARARLSKEVAEFLRANVGKELELRES